MRANIHNLLGWQGNLALHYLQKRSRIAIPPTYKRPPKLGGLFVLFCSVLYNFVLCCDFIYKFG